MSYTSIRQKIIEVLLTATSIQHAYPTEVSNFDGFPAAVVAPSESEADYGSTDRDKRVYVYTIKIYYPIKDEDSQATVEYRVEEVVDEVLSLFKTRAVLGTYADWVEPAPSAWGSVVKMETVYRTALVTLRCVKMIVNTP